MALRPRRASIVGMLLCMVPVNIDAKYLVNNPYFSRLQKLCTNPTCLLFFIIVRIEVVIARHAANYTYKTGSADFSGGREREYQEYSVIFAK